MKKVYRFLISSFLLFTLIFVITGCSNSRYVATYKYDGSIYDESYDYKNNYGYNYFLNNNTKQSKLYEDTYLRAIDFKNKKINYSKKKKYALFFKAKCKEYNLTIKEIRQVFDTFFYENPMFYFLNEINFDLSKDYVNIEIYKDYFKYEDRLKYNKIIEDGLIEFDNNMIDTKDDYLKVKHIYDYIVSNMSYEDNDDDFLYYAHNILGFFDNKEGVCETYTKTFILLCNRCNIDCLAIYTADHVWNMAKVYDMWFMFDLVKEDFGFSEDYYFSKNNLEDPYDDSLIEMPKTADSSLSLSEIVLFEDDVELYRSHSIDDVYKRFNGGNYVILLDTINRSVKEKTVYINSINSNYESLKIYASSKKKGGDFFLKYDTFIHFSKDLYILKDITIFNVGFEGDFPTNDTGISAYIRIKEDATFTYSFEGTWRFCSTDGIDGKKCGEKIMIDENGEVREGSYYSPF